MAAKQGLSAQISQASEDAKRAVLQRTSLTNSLWFSNLNTTCTIKSAPPRTPDVLGLLAMKSGWLFKRNEQHVWQPRYCCVVPHTFLYYFDNNPSNPCQTPVLTAKQQEQLNKAVRQGYGKRGALKQQQPRSSLYHVLGTTQNVSPDDTTDSAPGSSTLQPAGIIDLECYSTVHRNSQNQLLMELAGDESVNPDLRSFYFCANTEDEGEEWTQALLQNRHSALVDEKEAYRQVCDGFAQQLQMLHSELENSQHLSESRQEELYRVRSQMEDTRRSCLRLVQDTLERSEGTVPAKRAYRTDLETIQAQDLGILAAVQLLCDYTRVLEETCFDQDERIAHLETRMERKVEGDSSKVKQLEAELERVRGELTQQQSTWQNQVDTLSQKYVQTQKECQDVQKELASQRMEMTMYQSSTRTKMGELQTHKKILKKEVIELRKKLEEANSQLDLFKHKESSVKMEVEQERQKSKLLESYVEKMESQVKIQQNMMEMMSSAGSQFGDRSQYGGSLGPSGIPDYQIEISGESTVRSPTNKSYSQRRDFGQIILNTPSSVQHEEDDDEEHLIPISSTKRSASTPRRTIDDDAKSHMSELTEDRTQKQFDAAFLYQQQQQLQQNATYRAMGASPRNIPHQAGNGAPPSIIIGGIREEERSDRSGSNGDAPKLDTIMSTHSATRPRNEIPRYDAIRPTHSRTPSADISVSSYGSKTKLSVAQRARMEADRQSTPVRVRVNPNSNPVTTPLRGNASNAARKESSSASLKMFSSNATTSSNNSTSSFFSNLGKRLEHAIDNSLLGVDDMTDSSYQSTDVGTDEEDRKNPDTAHKDEKKTSEETSSETSTNVSLSLAQRQALQRAQQMKFLKQQGLITDEKDIRGGAGAASPSASGVGDGTSSVPSFTFGKTSSGRSVTRPLGDGSSSVSSFTFRRQNTK